MHSQHLRNQGFSYNTSIKTKIFNKICGSFLYQMLLFFMIFFWHSIVYITMDLQIFIYSYELSPSIFNLLFLALVLWAWSCSGCFLCPTDPISWIKVSTHSVPLYFYKTNCSGSIINFSYPIENWATFPRVVDLVSWRTVLIMKVWILVIPGIY